jgi:pyrroloquinoline quinone (PQQ) biosynthesis protein C
MVNGLSPTINGHRLQAATAIVDEYEAIDVSAHPLFVRLATNPVDLQALWILVANTNAGISPNFVRWLALAIARMPDYRVSSLLAKQLDDELGNGKPDRIHRKLLERFVAGLEPWSPREPAQRELEAGERLAARSGEVFDSGTAYEAVGGLMVAEIFAKKMDRCLGDEIRRQSLVPREALEWLELHEVLEIDHAADSYELAVLVPEQGPPLAATWQGARTLWAAMWGFLDDVLAAVSAARPIGA